MLTSRVGDGAVASRSVAMIECRPSAGNGMRPGGGGYMEIEIWGVCQGTGLVLWPKEWEL